MTDQATREAAADLIDGAIDVLHERGWCQGTLENAAGNVCVVGAVEVVFTAGKSGWYFAVPEAYSAIAAEANFLDPVCFNNAPSTTFEDVVLTMKRAAASLREVA